MPWPGRPGYSRLCLSRWPAEAARSALGPQGLFNPAGVHACAAPFAPAFEALADRILRHLESQCLPAPLITASGALVCSAGEELSPGVTCSADCLELAECTVTEVTAGASGSSRTIPRCPAAVTGTDCGASCPCWRLVRMPEQCSARETGSPYALQVLRPDGLLAPFGTHALATCRATPAAWGSDALANAPQCDER